MDTHTHTHTYTHTHTHTHIPLYQHSAANTHPFPLPCRQSWLSVPHTFYLFFHPKPGFQPSLRSCRRADPMRRLCLRSWSQSVFQTMISPLWLCFIGFKPLFAVRGIKQWVEIGKWVVNSSIDTRSVTHMHTYMHTHLFKTQFQSYTWRHVDRPSGPHLYCSSPWRRTGWWRVSGLSAWVVVHSTPS